MKPVGDIYTVSEDQAFRFSFLFNGIDRIDGQPPKLGLCACQAIATSLPLRFWPTPTNGKPV